jgi:hypothetical protein
MLASYHRFSPFSLLTKTSETCVVTVRKLSSILNWNPLSGLGVGHDEATLTLLSVDRHLISQ